MGRVMTSTPKRMTSGTANNRAANVTQAAVALTQWATRRRAGASTALPRGPYMWACFGSSRLAHAFPIKNRRTLINSEGSATTPGEHLSGEGKRGDHIGLWRDTARAKTGGQGVRDAFAGESVRWGAPWGALESPMVPLTLEAVHSPSRQARP